MILPLLAGAAAWELTWWMWRRHRRGVVYQQALAHARALGRPLVVIGAPDAGPTSGYGCGDVTVDLAHSHCPVHLRADVTKPLPFVHDSVVVFCSCVLEYVQDHQPALAEIQRVSGGHMFFVGVEPWTLTSVLYPGAKRTLPPRYR